MSRRVEYTLIREDAAGGREILQNGPSYLHGITDTWIAPAAPSPPTDLIA